jgi:hypothetical protein
MLMLLAAVADLVQEPSETGVGTEIQSNWSSPERLKTDDLVSIEHSYKRSSNRQNRTI